jgi:type I restriction enzyme S subunit
LPYKSSGGEMVDSEFGEIPAGWEVSKLGGVCDIIMGQSPKSEFYNEIGEGLPFHQGVTNFGERFPEDKMYCAVENKIAEYGDILFSVRAPVGRINIAKSRMVIGRGLSAIKHKREFQSFLFYQLKDIFTEEDSIGSGTVFNAITRKDLNDLLVIVPNKEIDKQFNELIHPIEKQIENNFSQNKELSQIRDLLLPKLMSGEIDVSEVEI